MHVSGYVGEDYFSYIVYNVDSLYSDVGEVTLTIQDVDDPPSVSSFDLEIFDLENWTLRLPK